VEVKANTASLGVMEFKPLSSTPQGNEMRRRLPGSEVRKKPGVERSLDRARVICTDSKG
jgi:hypothetical protein